MTVQCSIIDRGLKIVSGAVVLLLLCTSAALAQPKREAKSAEPSVAIVNGTAIPYSWYERARLTRLQQLSVGRDSVSLDAVEDDAILLSLIDAELVREEGAKRGITVGRDKAIDLLVADPPAYIRDIFTDKGKLQAGKLRDVVRNPDHILNYVNSPQAPKQKILADWKADLEHLLRFYTGEETRRRLIDKLYGEKPLSEENVEHHYYAEKTFLEGSVIRVLHSTVPDSLVPVSDAEARVWFEGHKEEYRIPESRFISSLILPVIPSAADSAEHQERLKVIEKTITSLPVSERLAEVERLSRALPPNRVPVDRWISPTEFSGDIRADLAASRTGDVLGPYSVENESLLLYVADEAASTDTLVRVRHVLVKINAEMTQEERDGLYRFCVLLRDSIDSEEEFKEAVRHFSDDNESIERDGDMGYMERGRFVPEFDSAVFSAPVGKAVGPVQTRFGYHLIWVIDRHARSYALRELRVPLRPAQSVHDAVMNDAEDYAALLRTGYTVDSAMLALHRKYPGMLVDSGTVLKRLEPYGDILSTGEFVFQAQAGDVGIFALPYDRIAVIELRQIFSWKDGLPPFDDIIVYPLAHAQRKKQLDTLQVRLRDMAQKMTPDMLLGPIREMAPMAEAFLLKGQPIIVMPDEDPTLLDSLAAVTPVGGVSGPVRGKHALYFLRVSERFGPDAEQFRREKDVYSEDYRSKYRQELLESVLYKARSYAQVEDLRSSKASVEGRGS